MTRFVVPSVFLGLLCLSAAPAHAQEQGKVGAVMAIPASIGFIWHATDSIAVRPEISFGFSSTEAEAAGLGLDGEIDSSNIGIGASVLFYGAGTDNVRTYLSPRFEIGRSSYDNGDEDRSTNNFSLSGSFGAEYSPVPRFSMFGEIGLEYARSSASFDVGPETFDTRSTVIGTRAAVGVILYFRGV